MLDFGVSPQEFRSRFLERQVYVRHAALAERPLQWSDFDSVLHAIEPDETSVQLFNHGPVAPQTYLDDSVEFGRQRRRLNQQRFYALLQEGATLVLNHFESQSVAAKRLCAEVARFVGFPTTGNAYASFGGNGTFGKHWDTHDVFAIQLIGKKRWQVFQPTFPLPLSNHTSRQSQQACPATPVLDIVLSTGDLLYIPRGWWHQVIPFDASSLHLSVGAYLPTLSDYLMWVCSRQLPRHIKARGGLIDDAASIAALPEVLQAIEQAALTPQHLEEFKRELQARERLSSAFDTALFLDKPAAPMADTTRLMLTSWHTADRERTEIRINGGRMKLEPVSRAVVQLLDGATVLTLAELYQRLPQVPQSSVHSAVLELARYEVLSIERR